MMSLRAALFVTDQRLLFSQPKPGLVNSLTTLVWFSPLVLIAPLLVGLPNLRRPQEFALKRIDKWWPSHAEHGSGPIFQIGHEAWTFRLLADTRGWKRPAYSEARALYDAAEEAYRNARGES
jgi:hypothetical protein